MNRSLILVVVVSVIVAVFALGCSRESSAGSASSSQEGLPDRDPALARKLVSEGAALIDVRTVDEYAERHLDKAVNIPVDKLNAQMAEIDKLASGDKAKPIVVYCKSGGRAARAKSMLAAAGYTKVTNLGGIDDWDKK